MLFYLGRGEEVTSEMFFQDFDTPIQRREVLDWFGPCNAFEQAHLGRANFEVIEQVVIEEDVFV